MRSARFVLLSGLVLVVGCALSGCLATSPGEPRAIFTASLAEATIPFTASFDGSLSYAPQGDIVSYIWAFGDGGGGSGPVASHEYEENGTYAVELTVIDARGKSGKSSLVVRALNPLPTASFSYAPKSRMDDGYIVGASEWITFDASKSTDDEEIVAYDWNYGDATYDQGPTVKHRYTYAGEYNVVLTVTDNDGGKTNYVETIHILGGPPCNADLPGGGTCP
jgi:PKD repeat protein